MLGVHPIQTQTLRRALQHSKHSRGVILPQTHQVRQGTGSAEVEMNEGVVPMV